MKLTFDTVDVFTDRPFGGNPLAVVRNGEGLTTELMQRIASEFNLSETTFVLPPADPRHTANVRIFTPQQEVPFAGHPNVGTAFVLGRLGEIFDRPVKDRVVFEETAGLVEIDLFPGGARLAAPQTVTLGDTVDAELVAKACSIPASAVETGNHEPRIVSSGIPFVMVELRSLEALGSARPRTDVFVEHFPPEVAIGIHLYVPVEMDGADIRCRMFAPLQGVFEDPATGSANVALIGFLAGLEKELVDSNLERTIVQGVEMGRRSVLKAEAEKRKGKVTRTWIGGSSVAMMEGVIELAG